MRIKEKVAYMKGLAEGMKIEATDEGRLLCAIIETLEEMAEEIESLSENALDIGEELDALSDDLADVEEFLDELDFDDEDFDFDGFDDFADSDDDDEQWDDDYNDDNPCCEGCGSNDDDAEISIDVYCTECGTGMTLTEENIINESITCPACNKVIELQIDEVDADEDDNNDGQQLRPDENIQQ